MKFENIKQEVVQEAVDDMKDPFYTKQISNHPIVTKAHMSFVEDDWQYHSSIGKFLSARKDELGICKVDDTDPDLGQLWKKTT